MRASPRLIRAAFALGIAACLAPGPALAFGPEKTGPDGTAAAEAEDADAVGERKESPGLKRDDEAPVMDDEEPTPEDTQLTETQKMQRIRNEEVFQNYATKEDLDAVLKSVREWQEYANLMRLYGSFRMGLAIQSGGSSTVQDLSPRIGLRGQAKLNDKINVAARVELGLNLVDQQSNEIFIQGDQQGNERLKDEDAVTTRLGQAGLVGDWGSILIGKQWSVYYDVTQWTDMFWAVGGNASGTYNASTDGGVSGTGRAEKAVTTRFRWRGLRLGAQAQLRSRTENDQDQADTWGVSAIGDLAFLKEWGAISYGIAFNKVRDGVNDPGVNEPKEGDESTAAGLLYQSGKWYGAVVLNRSKNHEIDDQGRWFDARGAEAFVMYSFKEGWEVHGGLNWLEPDNYRFRDDDGTLQKSQYRRRYLAYGISRRFSRESVLFMEGTIEDSDEADGGSLRNSLIGIGGYYTF